MTVSGSLTRFPLVLRLPGQGNSQGRAAFPTPKDEIF